MQNYKVDTIVREYLLGIGDSQFSRYTRFYQFAVDGVREWNMDLTGLPNCVLLPVNDNDTADIPYDCLNWTFIGIIGSDGLMYPLGKRNDIALAKEFGACGDPQKYSSPELVAGDLVGILPDLYAEHFRNGQLAGKFFGAGGGNNGNGYYRIDEKLNQITLSGISMAIRGIYLEYISDITAVDKDYSVHPFMLETLKAWIYWKSIERDRNFSLGEKALAEESYWKRYRISKKRFNSTPLSVWYEAIRSQNKAAPKF